MQATNPKDTNQKDVPEEVKKLRRNETHFQSIMKRLQARPSGEDHDAACGRLTRYFSDDRAYYADGVRAIVACIEAGLITYSTEVNEGLQPNLVPITRLVEIVISRLHRFQPYPALKDRLITLTNKLQTLTGQPLKVLSTVGNGQPTPSEALQCALAPIENTVKIKDQDPSHCVVSGQVAFKTEAPPVTIKSLATASAAVVAPSEDASKIVDNRGVINTTTESISRNQEPQEGNVPGTIPTDLLVESQDKIPGRMETSGNVEAGPELGIQQESAAPAPIPEQVIQHDEQMADVTSSLPDPEEKSRHSHQTSARSSTVSSRADSPIPDALPQNSTGNQSAIDNTNDMPIDPVATPTVTSEPGEVENGMLLDNAPSKAPTGSSTGPSGEGSRVLLRFDSSRSDHVIDSFFVDNKNGVSFRIKCVAQSQELLGAFWAVINGSNSYLLQGVGADGEQDSSSIDVSSAVALGRNVIYWFGLRHNLARTSVFTLEMVST